jgi:flagella basal body P-ring formation protein FlgA
VIAMTLRFMIAFCVALLVLPVIPALAANTDASIVVPARDIARGEIIAKSDLAYGTAQASQMRSGTITDAEGLLGMQARRYLRAGEPVLASDVRKPIVVTKGETVTMTFDAPGISLTATGRSLGEGGIGESVTVVNPASYRQVMATVTGPGTVRAESALPLNAKSFRTAQTQY